MGKRSVIFPVFVILILPLVTCIDPFNPKLDKYQSLLVVDALVTNEEVPGYVRLTRTSVTPDEPPTMVSGAMVSITDNLGSNTLLSEVSDGIYKTDSPAFRGEAGRQYTLKIHTQDGKEYESDPGILYEAREIDTVYFGRESQTTENGEVQEGITIYADSKSPTESRYFRRAYEEWWKFSVPYPVTHKYVDEGHIYEIPIENVTCFKNRKSDEIMIQLNDPEVNGGLIKSPVCFIASEKSDRLLLQYCIEVSQYSISEEEYEFWRLMKEINESGGDIFDKQPFSIISNIHCLSDPGERVLGYFQVCGASKKRIYIKGSEIEAMGLKPYNYVCDLVMKGPQDYIASENPMTFDGYIKTSQRRITLSLLRIIYFQMSLTGLYSLINFVRTAQRAAVLKNLISGLTWNDIRLDHEHFRKYNGVKIR
jgi:hypothetical protein